jgi:hypothetical protein
MKKLSRIVMNVLILIIALSAYQIAGSTGLLIALIFGFAMEVWFWRRVLPKRRLRH